MKFHFFDNMRIIGRNLIKLAVAIPVGALMAAAMAIGSPLVVLGCAVVGGAIGAFAAGSLLMGAACGAAVPVALLLGASAFVNSRGLVSETAREIKENAAAKNSKPPSASYAPDRKNGFGKRIKGLFGKSVNPPTAPQDKKPPLAPPTL